MVLLITYDLKRPGQDYSSLHAAIKELGSWWHYLESTWLVATGSSTLQVSERLRKEIDQNDSLLIIRVTKDYSGWLAQDAWDWLNRQEY
jgi:hypothetical protein